MQNPPGPWLQRLLGEAAAAFMSGHAGREFFRRSDAEDPFAELVSLRDLELLLFNTQSPDRSFQAVGGANGAGGAAGVQCTADEAIDAWANGGTLVFNGIDRRLPAVADLARGLEGELKCRVWCNLYLTPARGQGFEAHYDSHDVFILQLMGSKQWRLGGLAAEAPMPFQEHERITVAAEDAVWERRLEAGDVLYIPRGMAHEAFAEEDLSAHLTIGLYPKTYLDLIVTAVTLAADADPRFRQHLPLGSFEISDEVVARARDLMAGVPQEQFREAGDAFCELLGSERGRSPLELLALQGRSGQLTDADRFRAVPHLICSLSPSDAGVELHALGQALTFPAHLADDLVLCCSGRVFGLADLQAPAERRGDLVRRLLFGGVVRRISLGEKPVEVPTQLIRHSR